MSIVLFENAFEDKTFSILLNAVIFKKHNNVRHFVTQGMSVSVRRS